MTNTVAPIRVELQEPGGAVVAHETSADGQMLYEVDDFDVGDYTITLDNRYARAFPPNQYWYHQSHSTTTVAMRSKFGLLWVALYKDFFFFFLTISTPALASQHAH